MSVMFHTARLLLEMRRKGSALNKVATLGRQWWLVHPTLMPLLDRLMRAAGLGAEARARVMALKAHEFADPFFIALGVQQLDAVDYSPYEGAAIVHDLNRPIGAEHENQYDLVFDGGCLEHVFNFPVAVASAMRMVRPGGHLMIHGPCNNQAGHGFYQYSPELMFRILDAPQGFESVAVLVHEIYRQFESSSCYRVVDPATLGMRVGVDGGHGLMILAVGRKIAATPPFETSPLQSDYVPLWQQSGTSQAGSVAGNPHNRRSMTEWLDRRLPRLTSAMRTIAGPLRNRTLFQLEWSPKSLGR